MCRLTRQVTGAPARLGAVLAACIAVIFRTVKVLESTPATSRLATRPKPFHALLIAGAALAAAASLTTPHPAGASVTHRPTPCPHGHAVASACQLITSYFDALNRGDEARACSLLGARLLLETGGPSCPSVVAMSRGTPFRIIGARRVGTTVLVRVKVGLHELDHWRMLDWVAVVGLEGSHLKILDTKRV